METTNNTLDKVRHAASEAYTSAVDKGREAVGKSVRFVRRNPVGTIIGAVATGFLVAWALNRRSPDWAERNLAEPARRFGGWIRGAADQATGAYESARDKVVDAYGSARDRVSDTAEAALAAGNKAVRKFRFW